MCRLFSWSSGHELSLEQVLGEDIKLLTDLSTLHQDGWGGALNHSGRIDVVRDLSAAHESKAFTDLAHAGSATSGMVHLRWATSSYAVCLENTHPFADSQFAFEHNGGFNNADSLIPLIDEDLLDKRIGTVDSELYYLYLRTLLRTMDMVSAYRILIPFMEANTAYTSLNAMILTPTHLYVVAAYADARRPSDVEDDYYHLSYNNSGELFTAWSSGVRSIDGTQLPNNHILTLELSSNSLTIDALI